MCVNLGGLKQFHKMSKEKREMFLNEKRQFYCVYQKLKDEINLIKRYLDYIVEDKNKDRHDYIELAELTKSLGQLIQKVCIKVVPYTLNLGMRNNIRRLSDCLINKEIEEREII